MRDRDMEMFVWGMTGQRPNNPHTVLVGSVHLAAIASAFVFDVLRATAAAVADLTGGNRR